MRWCIWLCGIAFLLSCSSSSSSESKIEGKKEVEVRQESSSKINIKEELKMTYEGRFLSIRDSVLSLIEPEVLYRPLSVGELVGFKKDESNPNDIKYSKGGSIIRLYYWETDELTSEYQELRDTGIIGHINDSTILFSSGVRIQMSKEEFFQLFFENYEGVIDTIRSVAVCEDERGEAYTVYKFEKGVLSEIEFGNNSVW